jgi:hypothetical protein
LEKVFNPHPIQLTQIKKKYDREKFCQQISDIKCMRIARLWEMNGSANPVFNIAYETTDMPYFTILGKVVQRPQHLVYRLRHLSRIKNYSYIILVFPSRVFYSNISHAGGHDVL